MEGYAVDEATHFPALRRFLAQRNLTFLRLLVIDRNEVALNTASIIQADHWLPLLLDSDVVAGCRKLRVRLYVDLPSTFNNLIK